jgi:hypothetical protein
MTATLMRESTEKLTPEMVFREGATNLCDLLEAFAPVCDSVVDLHGMLKLALENDGQCRMMVSIIQNSRKR